MLNCLPTEIICTVLNRLLTIFCSHALISAWREGNWDKLVFVVHDLASGDA